MPTAGCGHPGAFTVTPASAANPRKPMSRPSALGTLVFVNVWAFAAVGVGVSVAVVVGVLVGASTSGTVAPRQDSGSVTPGLQLWISVSSAFETAPYSRARGIDPHVAPSGMSYEIRPRLSISPGARVGPVPSALKQERKL